MNFPKEQYEAAQSVGMRAGQRFRRIVLPQIVRASLPGLVNEMSLLIKVTPVLAVVGVVDITRAAVRIGAQTYEPLPPFLVAVALYAPIVFALVSLQRWIERRQVDGRGRRMIHDFGIVWSERALLLSGLANTAILSALSAAAALLLGFMLTPALMSKRSAIAGTARVFVDGMRCVPFLLFAYIVYYGFPSLGVRLDNWTSGLAGVDDLQCRLHGGDSARRLGRPAARADRGRHRFRLFGDPRCFAASSFRRCCWPPGR